MEKQQEPKYNCTMSGHVYNRDTSVMVPDEEPIFIIRAKDIHAVPTLRTYLGLCTSVEHQLRVKGRIKHFEEFATLHPERMKEPD